MPHARWLAVAVSVAFVPLAACNRMPAPESAAVPPQAAATPARTYSDQDISDAYLYLLSRLLVLRQQQLDLKEGFKWNEVVHRKPGAVDWANPNLDVAYSEAWVAIDENGCTLVTVPRSPAAITPCSSSTAGARRWRTSTSARSPNPAGFFIVARRFGHEADDIRFHCAWEGYRRL